MNSEVNLVPNQVKKILIAGLGGIGDILFFLPSFKALRASFKEASIDLLVLPNGTKGLFEGRGIVDSVEEFPYYKWHKKQDKKDGNKHFALLQAIKTIRKRKYDLCIWPYAVTSFKKQLLASILGAKINIMHKGVSIFSRHPISKKNNLISYARVSHGVERNAELMRYIGVDASKEDVTLPLSDDEIVWGKSYLEDIKHQIVIGFHPGGNLIHDSHRQWKPAKFAELADKLANKYGAISLFICSNSEEQSIARISKMMRTRSVTVTNLSLRKVAAIIKNLNMFIGNNSGLVHLSAALGTKTISIFGPTDVNNTGPRGKESYVIRKDIFCSPCYDYNIGRLKQKCSHNNMCLDALSSDEVFYKVQNIIESSNRIFKTTKNNMPIIYNLSGGKIS